MINKKDHFGFSVGSEIPSTVIYKGIKGGLDLLVRKRFTVTILLVFFVFVIIAINLFSTVEIFKKETAVYGGTDYIRGNILDRNGDVLATNLSTKNLYSNSTKILDATESAKGLVKAFPDLKYDEVYKKLTNKKTFTYIKKKLTPAEEHKVKLIGDPGLLFEESQERVYPLGKGTAHVLGIVDSENNGVFGIENMFNEQLKGKATNVSVSIDSRIQNIVYKILSNAVERFQAKGAAVLLMNPNTGEVLAMVSLPAFDPKDIGAYNDDAKFNKVTQGVYELGSVFKLFNTAAALEFGVSETKKFEVWKPIKLGRFTITDFHRMKEQYATMEDILAKSSNIGSVHIVEEMGIEHQRQFLDKMSLLSPMKSEFKVAPPILPKTWNKASAYSVSYGYTISMSPYQYLTSMNAFANGGFYIYPRFDVAIAGESLRGHKVVEKELSDKMRGYMARVMLDGSGQWSRVRGINLGGKTGTANKLINGSYANKAVQTTFVSAFPIENPRYTLFVMFDEPKEKPGVHGRTAGANAAPVTKEIIESIYHLLDFE
ncbi:MAG: penicillin-binding protein 2 [Rickettsiales bacterium]|nr:penicillin-binding protein 2 [Rickettsiales bacterium]